MAAMEGPAESTATRNNLNMSNPSKPVMENTETGNEDRKSLKYPRIWCEYLPFPPIQGFGFTYCSLISIQSPFLATFRDLPTSYHSAPRQIQTEFSLVLYLLHVMVIPYIIQTKYLDWTTTLEIREESASVTSAF